MHFEGCSGRWKKTNLTVHEYYHEIFCKCNAVLILRENIGIRVKCKHEKCTSKHAMANKENFQTVHIMEKNPPHS